MIIIYSYFTNCDGFTYAVAKQLQNKNDFSIASDVRKVKFAHFVNPPTLNRYHSELAWSQNESNCRKRKGIIISLNYLFLNTLPKIGNNKKKRDRWH